MEEYFNSKSILARLLNCYRENFILMARLLKRSLDLAAALFVLIALSPLLLLIAMGVLVLLGSPVFFRQTRPGRGARPFVLYKFRTMRDASDPAGRPLPDAQRLTSLGRVLRRTSLDELPQLWNVVRGEMSLVGPRPLLMEYLDRYTPAQARRHDVLPGITGYAQVRGRNAITWEEKFDLDVWYVDHWSLGLDMKLLAQTLLNVATGAGISAPEHATMPEFRGSRKA